MFPHIVHGCYTGAGTGDCTSAGTSAGELILKEIVKTSNN